MMDNLWSRELAREPALLRRAPCEEWRGSERSTDSRDPTRLDDMAINGGHGGDRDSCWCMVGTKAIQR